MRGYIEVSKHEIINNSSRPSGTMESHRNVIKPGGVRRATRFLQKHEAVFSHYVNSIRNGRIAVYVINNNDAYSSLRLKNYSKNKLKRIKRNLTTI